LIFNRFSYKKGHSIKNPLFNNHLGAFFLVIIGKLDSKSTSGEKKFYNLVERLDEPYSHYSFYFQPKIISRYPDFMIFGPDIGVIIIEVKDYTDQISTIVRSGDWVSNDGSTLRNPFDQVYNYFKELHILSSSVDELQDINNYIQKAVIFPEITNDSPIATKINEIIPNDFIAFFRNDIHSTFNHFQSEFKTRIQFKFNLSTIQLLNLNAKFISENVVPTLRQTNFGKFLDSDAHIMLLDKEQQILARELGDGHRIIFGVAGGGKTVVLIARAKYLARKYPEWNILFLCYNRILSQYLERVLEVTNFKNIVVSTYHSYVINAIKTSTDDIKADFTEIERKYDKKNDDFYQKVVPELFIKANSINPFRKFDAILIDEGQDFNPLWYQSIMNILNPETNSLLIAIDGLQSIYKRKKIVWSQINIQARGRTKYFTKSYRNPKNIGEFARAFLLSDKEISQDIEEDEELIKTVDFIREGGEVTYFRDRHVWENRERLADMIQEYFNKGMTILVLFKRRYTKESKDKDELLKILGQRDQKFNYMENWRLDSPGINISTIHGAKGLEADVVVIPDIDDYGTKKEKRRLCYVAMTRAIKYLAISAKNENNWTDEIEKILKIEKIEVPKGCCITCSIVIDFDNKLHFIRCKTCWSQNKDNEKGKYCHNCGKESEITISKPLCKDCYTKIFVTK
jgi:hypothetical protein